MNLAKILSGINWKGRVIVSTADDTNYPDTFIISPDGKSITCKHCKMTSHNSNDVEKLYCGHCHVFHDDIWPPARQWWIDHPRSPFNPDGYLSLPHCDDCAPEFNCWGDPKRCRKIPMPSHP